MNLIYGTGEYGVIGNVSETDRVFRKGAKVWLTGGTGGEGAYRFQWIGMSRGGRVVEKWAPTTRFSNFRAAWVPKHLQERVTWIRGSKEDVEKYAADLNKWADEMRAESPNRRR